MKSEEILLILKAFQKTIKKDANEQVVFQHLIKRIEDIILGLRFYEQGHYDNGFIARKSLDSPTAKDAKLSGRMTYNAHHTRRSAWESES